MLPSPPFLQHCSWHCLVSPLGRTCGATSNPYVVCFSSASCIFLYGHSMAVSGFFSGLDYFVLYFYYCYVFAKSEITSLAWGICLSVWVIVEDKKKDYSSSYPLSSPSFKHLLTSVPSLAPVPFCTMRCLKPLLESLLNQQRDGKICLMSWDK